MFSSEDLQFLCLFVTLGIIVLTLGLNPAAADALLNFRHQALHEFLIPADESDGVLALAPSGVAAHFDTF